MCLGVCVCVCVRMGYSIKHVFEQRCLHRCQGLLWSCAIGMFLQAAQPLLTSLNQKKKSKNVQLKAQRRQAGALGSSPLCWERLVLSGGAGAFTGHDGNALRSAGRWFPLPRRRLG